MSIATMTHRRGISIRSKTQRHDNRRRHTQGFDSVVQNDGIAIIQFACKYAMPMSSQRLLCMVLELLRRVPSPLCPGEPVGTAPVWVLGTQDSSKVAKHRVIEPSVGILCTSGRPCSTYTCNTYRLLLPYLPSISVTDTGITYTYTCIINCSNIYNYYIHAHAGQAGVTWLSGLRWKIHNNMMPFALYAVRWL